MKKRKKSNVWIDGVWLPQRTITHITGVDQASLSLAMNGNRNYPHEAIIWSGKIAQLMDSTEPVELTDFDLGHEKIRNKDLLRSLNWVIKLESLQIDTLREELKKMPEDYAILDNTRKLMVKLLPEIPQEKDSLPEAAILYHRRRVAKKILACDAVAQKQLSHKISVLEANVAHAKEMVAMLSA